MASLIIPITIITITGIRDASKLENGDISLIPHIIAVTSWKILNWLLNW